MADNFIPKVTRTYWIRWTAGETYYTRFFKRGYGHLSLLIKEGDHWVSFDPRGKLFEWNILPFKGSDDLPWAYSCQGNTTQIIGITITYDEESLAGLSIFRPMAFFAPCVSFVKYCLGIRRWWIWTPYQLYKCLIKHNQVLRVE